MSATMGMDCLFEQYRGLVWYAAKVYSDYAHVERDDLFQEGSMFLVKYFQKHPLFDDPRTVNTFKKSLFLIMRRRASVAARGGRLRGQRMVRIQYDRDDADGGTTVNLDEMLVAADSNVLLRMYMREFSSELRRLLCRQDRSVLRLITEYVDSGESHRKMVGLIAERLNVSASIVYKRVRRIQDVVLRVMSRDAA